MDHSDQRAGKDTSWWIASLAISIVLCAVFAGYLFDIKVDLEGSKTRDAIIEERLDILSSEIDNLRRHEVVQQVQVVPPDAHIQMPTLTTPKPEEPAAVPAPAAPPAPPASKP